MAGRSADAASSGTRKSMNLLPRPLITGLTKIDTSISGASTQRESKDKTSKRSKIFRLGPPAVLEPAEGNGTPAKDGADSPSLRPKTLSRSRPQSMFGSLSKKKSPSVHEKEVDSVPPSPVEDAVLRADGNPTVGKMVRHHGEVQTTSGMFRKKKEYLVLTDTHLIRFKSQARAVEVFPAIRRGFGRQSSTRHPSTNSISSLQDAQSQHSHNSLESEVCIPLEQIVTVYRIAEVRPFFTTEVVYLDEAHYSMGSLQLMLNDPSEADLWLSSIRAAAMATRVRLPDPFPEKVVLYLVRVLEMANDYDPERFRIYRIVRRPAVSKNSRSSSDDINKLGAALFYMVIGINRVHMVPIPDFSETDTPAITAKASRNSFGIVTMVTLNVLPEDDRFDVAFRSPMQPTLLLQLAASATTDIAIDLLMACNHLKPQWLDPWYTFGGPRHLVRTAEERCYRQDDDLGCFDRTLIAYCSAYSCKPDNIQYGVDWNCDDAPVFTLYPPAETTRYSLHELLAVFRSLRYNELFRAISFRGIDLHVMHGLHDEFGTNHVAFTSRAGISVEAYFNLHPAERSLLYQEVQALCLKSGGLRRLDFADCLPRRQPRDNFDVEEEGISETDPGCEIVAAILPLIRCELSKVDWLVLNGIELGETDFEDLSKSVRTQILVWKAARLKDIAPALSHAKARLRAIEFARTGLNDRGLLQMLSHLERQNATLEYLNIADNPGKIPVERFKISMSCFSNLRRLDLSRTTRALGTEPLFDPGVMLGWRLEELIMNGVPVNDKTLDNISAYLASPKSENLRVLQMDQCNLTGSHVAILMRSMTHTAGEARNLSLHVSTNKLEKGINKIAKAIEENHTPSRLVCKMIEFTDERYFRQFLHALKKNTTIKYLDISKASLPYDASDETCEVLRQVFAENVTLEDLDISGEHAHLEVTRFGIGLNQALTGLKNNTTLRSLRIEYQNLGLEGANTLSSVLEHNKGLTHIYCEHNNINLQGFTILVNAIANNHTVLDMPALHNDKGESMKQWRLDSNQAVPAKSDTQMKLTVRKTLTTLGVSKGPKAAPPPPDIDNVVRVLQEKWEAEVSRLTLFLARNRGLVSGELIPASQHEMTEEAMRPTTAISDRECIEQVIHDATPRVEQNNPVDNLIGLALGSPDRNASASADATPVKHDRPALVRATSGASSVSSLLAIRMQKPDKKQPGHEHERGDDEKHGMKD